GLGSGTLNDLLDSVRPVFLLVPRYELFCVVRVVTKGTNVVTAGLDMCIEIVVPFHHVQKRPFQDVQTSFFDESVVLVPKRTGKLHQRLAGDVTPGLHTEFPSGKGKKERECAEVVTLREVSSERAWQIPEISRRMRDGFFVGEEVGEPLHGDPKPLRQNVISSGCRLLSTFHIELISIVGDRAPDVRLSLHPHCRVGDFFKLVQLVMPDGYVRCRVIALENLLQFQLDRVARTVSNSAFRANGENKILVLLSLPLPDRTYDILANVAGQPLVNRCYFRPKTLEFRNR